MTARAEIPPANVHLSVALPVNGTPASRAGYSQR